MTYAYNNTMVMQSAYKGSHTSFLEEIQRDAKVSLSGAKHIILLGYQLPPDDVIWRSAIVAKQKNNAVYCSVVVGYMGEDRWLEGEELINYTEEKKENLKKEEWAGWGINAIDAATAIFGKKMSEPIPEEYRGFGVRTAPPPIKAKSKTCSTPPKYSLKA